MTHRILRSACSLICASIALFAAAGCSGNESEHNSSSREADLPAAESVSLPLDSYMFNEFEVYDISSLLRTRTLACMNEHGYATTALPVPPAPGVTKHNERRYGITDGRLANRLGYRTPKDNTASPVKRRTLSADEEFTLTGGSTSPGEVGKGGKNESGKVVPVGGCSGQALKALGYSATATPGNPSAAQSLDKESFVASLETESVKGALEAWSACMHDKGYTYAAEPFSASNDRRFATRYVTKAERDVATADVECKKSSHLVETWRTAEARIQRSLIAQHQQELSRILKQRDTTLSMIKKLSGSSA
jgi:hypothetical protein